MSWPLMMRGWCSSIVIFSDEAAAVDGAGVDVFLEWGNPQALRRFGKALALETLAHIHLQQAVYDFRHLQGGKRGADDLADGGGIALGAADRDLVELAAVLVHAQHTDGTDVVVAAGIDAAGNIQFDVADVVLEIEVVEALRDGGGNRQGLRIGQRAEIAARGADDLGQEADGRP